MSSRVWERAGARAGSGVQPAHWKGGGSSRAAWNWKWMVGCPGTPGASWGGALVGALQVARMSRYFFPLVGASVQAAGHRTHGTLRARQAAPE